MRRLFTLMFGVFVALLFFSSSIATAQTMNNTWSGSATWNASSSFRGFAYGNNRLYVAGYAGGKASLVVLNALTGEHIKTLDNSGILDLTFDLGDAEFSADGSILAAPVTTDASMTTGWGKGNYTIYRWKNEDAKPEPFIVYSGAGRVDMFSVRGDVTKNAVVMGALGSSNKVWRYIITNGVIGSVEEITLANTVKTGTLSTAYPAGLTAADGFWYNNMSTNPLLLNNKGEIIDSIPTALMLGTSASIKDFSVDGKDYLVVVDAGKARLFNKTGKMAKDLTADDIVYTGDGAWNTNQDVDYRVGKDGSISIYSFASTKGVYSSSTEAAPVATDLFLTDLTLVGTNAQVSYTFGDINGDLEGLSEIKWYKADDKVGTNKAEFNSGKPDYTFVEADVNKYVWFSVFPIAQTGTVKDSAYIVNSMMYGPVAPADSKAPVAKIDSVYGKVEVDQILTGVYTYSDENGDLEGASKIEWYRADNMFGANMVKIASDTLKYKLLPADADKYIIFSVTPIAKTGILVEGANVMLSTATKVFFPEFKPEAQNVAIAGIAEVTRTLKGSYTFFDLNGDLEGKSVLTWYRADAADGAKTVIASDTNMYKLVKEDEGKYVFFGVTPVTEVDSVGIEVFATTGLVAAEPAQEGPVAKNVMLHGKPEVGAILFGEYTYWDYTDDAEGATILKWYTADDAEGTNKSIIDGADMLSYVVTEAEVGKFIMFEVTPVALTGGILTGAPVADTTMAATIASTQEVGIARVWLASDKTGALPTYMNSKDYTERGFGVSNGDHLYIASRKNGADVVIVNKADGSYVGKLDMTGVKGGVFPIQDIEVSEDGQILGMGLLVQDSIWIYKWENELAQPTVWIAAKLPESMRFDKFQVVGDVSGNAIVMAAKASGNKICRWVVEGGLVGDLEVITLTGLDNMNVVASAVPLSASKDANILIDGKGLAPTIVDKDGFVLKTIARIDDYNNYKIQSNSPNVFKYKGRTLAAFYQHMRQAPFGARTVIADITDINNMQIIDSTEYISFQGGSNEYLGESDVVVDGDFYYVYQLQAKWGLGSWKGQLVAPQFETGITNWEGTEIYAQFTQELKAASVDTSAVYWTVKANDAVINVTSVTATGSEVKFVLASAVAEGNAVTLAYNGNGGVAAFNEITLEAFGPETIENITGADAPEAKDVRIEGTIAVNQTITGVYTFFDADGDAEGISTFKWYASSNADGTGATVIIGANEKTYTVESDYKDKYLAFEVTPFAATGGQDYLVGDAVKSAFVLVTSTADNFAVNVNIYPNPVKDQLTINNTEEISIINVIDLTGRIVNSVNVSGSIATIDMANMNSGVYMIQMVGENQQMSTQRIVKQ